MFCILGGGGGGGGLFLNDLILVGRIKALYVQTIGLLV